jgi:cell division protein FtsI (penicillin-binding protein 3)
MQSASPPANTVVVADAGQLRVPSLLGLSVRQVIEEAGSAGLEVEITGSGTAHEQAPAPGAMVTPGTKIVVRCAR